MADQRLIMKCEGREIVIAVRHGDEWRSAAEDRNDIGSFLNSLPMDVILEIGYENERSYKDLFIYASQVLKN